MPVPPAWALFALGNLKHDLAAVWNWLCHRSTWQLVSLGLAAFALVQHFQLVSARHEATKWHNQFNAEHTARAHDRNAYTQAQKDAQAANAATVARDAAERERITHDISQNYEAELARLRADLAQRLRPGATQGAPGATSLPQVSPAPSGPDGAARVSIPSSLYVHGAELELQLERLQQWVNEQLKVDPNK